MSTKYQPRICPKNSVRISEIPESVLEVSAMLSLAQLEEIETIFSSSHRILYVISDDSTSNKLIPIRDDKKNFKVIVTLTK